MKDYVLNETGYSGSKDTPTAASVLEKSDLAAGLTGDIKPKARPEDLFTTKQKNDAAAALLGGATTGVLLVLVLVLVVLLTTKQNF
jgi:hypothetical protein